MRNKALLPQWSLKGWGEIIVYIPVVKILVWLYHKKHVLLSPPSPETHCVCNFNKTSQTITLRVMFSDIFCAVLFISITDVILVLMLWVDIMSQSAIEKTMQCHSSVSYREQCKTRIRISLGMGQWDKRSFSEDFRSPWKQRVSTILKAKFGVIFVVYWNTCSAGEVGLGCFSHCWTQTPDRKQPKRGRVCLDLCFEGTTCHGGKKGQWALC